MLSARKTMCMLLVCLCIYGSAFAQANTTAKPKMFDHLPTSIAISETSLRTFFTLNRDQETVLNFSAQFSFPCRVLSNETKYANLQTVIVRSAMFGNAIFQVSRILNEDLSISYTGRILNERAFDGFVLKKAEGGTYLLEKFETDQVLDECKL